MFERLSLDPIYNTRAVVQRTGVPADTFRAWERRYRIPAPFRDDHNRRLYSEYDLSVIGWLRDQTRSGMTISQAVSLYSTLNGRTQNSAHGRAREPGLAGELAGEPIPFEEQHRQLLDAFIGFDEPGARQTLQESLAICTIENVCQDLLYRTYLAARERQKNSSNAELCERFAFSFVHRMLASLFSHSSPDHGRGPIVAACPCGELSDIDLLLISLFLSRHGYKVIYLGPNVSVPELALAIRKTDPKLVLLTASSEESAQSVNPTIRLLAASLDRLPRFAFGGSIFAQRPEYREGVEAFYIGQDARDSTTSADLLLASTGH
jgi:DNA-binding transcriptional MerR regulator